MIMRKIKMSYRQLNESFPYAISAHRDKVDELVRLLLRETRDDVTNGSSFAVTVDGQRDYWTLWMSETSRNYLKNFEEGV